MRKVLSMLLASMFALSPVVMAAKHKPVHHKRVVHKKLHKKVMHKKLHKKIAHKKK